MPNVESGFTPEEEHVQTECGLVAIYSVLLDTQAMVGLGLLAANGVQHRGQQGGGISYPTREGQRLLTGNGLLPDVFTSNVISTFNEENPGNWLQIHTRYGSDPEAAYSINNLQPLIAYSPEGSPVSVIHNGQFVAKDEIRKQVYELTGREYPDDVSDSFLAAQLIANAPGESWDGRVIEGINRLKGAFSLVVGVEDRLYLARDEQGLQPLVVGKLQDGWLATSETHALKKAGVKPDRSILRGEIARIDQRGLLTIQEGQTGQGNFCDFEWAYFGRPESRTPNFNSPDDAMHPERWLSHHAARRETGIIFVEELSRTAEGRELLTKIQMVTGAPDSGVSFGTGVAIGAKLPYESVIIRDHHDQNGKLRLFQEADIQKIQAHVAGKLSFVPGSIEGKIVAISDDSKVRSNVSKSLTEQAWAEGAAEVHWFLGYPPVISPCHLGKNMRTQEELIAWRHKGDLKKIAEEVTATSVNYISWRGSIEGWKQGGEIITPEDEREIFLANGGCGGCLTGLHPIAKDGTVYKLGAIKTTEASV